MPDRETLRFINSFAPWFSALGTISAVVTALYLAQRDRRVNLRARASLRVQFIVGGGPGHGERFVSINVSNRGRRPATITGLGFRIRGVQRGELLPSSPMGSKIPIKLEDGDEAAYLYPLDVFCGGLFQAMPAEAFRPFPALRLRTAQAIVATSVGRAFYATFSKDLQRELLARIERPTNPPVQEGRGG